MISRIVKYVIAVLCALLSQQSAIAYNFEADGIYYNKLTDTTCAVAAPPSTAPYSGALVIPESVTIPTSDDTGETITYTVTQVAASAFKNCTSLTAITIPATVTKIDNYAFNGCTSLTDLTFEDGDEVLSLGYKSSTNNNGYLGQGLFYDCPLGTVYLGRNLTYDAQICVGASPFRGCPITSFEIGGNVKNVETNLLRSCSKLAQVKITASIDSIKSHAFYGSSSLPEITIPNSVTSIASYAFAYCSALESLIIPNNVATVGDYAFYGCSSMISIGIAASVNSIGNYAFNGCTSLKEVTFKDCEADLSLGYNTYNAGAQGRGLFYDCPLETVSLGRNLTYTCTVNCGYSPFYGNAYLQNLTLGDYVNSIQENEFRRCTALGTVSLSDDITTIGEYAFEGCKALTSINIPNQVTSINRCLQNCSSLPELTIPAAVTDVANFAFNGCTSLTDLTFEDGDEVLSLGYKSSTNNNGYLGQGLFYDCPLGTVYLGRNLTYDAQICVGASPFRGCPITSFEIGGNVKNVETNLLRSCSKLAQVKITASIDAIKSYAFYDCSSLPEITLPESVTTIASYAFAYCTALESLIIPNNVATVGDYAFDDCSSMTSIGIAASVNSIGSYAFNGCTSLKEVTFKGGDADLSLGFNTYNAGAQGRGLFYDCPLETVYLGRNLTYTCTVNCGFSPFYGNAYLQNLTLGDYVNSIQENEFRRCTALGTVSLSDDITTIGEYAFEGCKALTSINIPNQVTSINRCLQNCSSLPELTIPAAVTDVANFAFNGCTSLTDLTFEDGDDEISLGYNTYNAGAQGRGLFYDCPLETVYLGRNLTYTCTVNCGYSPFRAQKNLTTLTLGKGAVRDTEADESRARRAEETVDLGTITEVPANAFMGCTGLTELYVPANVTTIGASAFSGCTGLTDITLADTEEALTINTAALTDVDPTTVYIGRNLAGYVTSLLNGRTNLESIEFVGGCTTVPNYCIKDCTNLEKLHFGENVTTIGEGAVTGCGAIVDLISDNTVPPTMTTDYVEDLYTAIKPVVPDESLDDYKAANIWEKFWPEEVDVAGVDGVYADGESADSPIHMEGNTIEVIGSENDNCRIIAINGTVIYNGKTNSKITLRQGVYLVVVNNRVYKVTSR